MMTHAPTFLEAIAAITQGAATLGGVIEQAEAFTRSGQAAEAAQLYRVWLQFSGDHPQRHAAHFNLSVLAETAGEADAAERALRSAVEASPDFLPAYINLGNLLERKGAIADAIAVWTAGVERVSAVTGAAVTHKALALKQIGRALIDHRQPEKAEVALRQCAELCPGQADIVAHLVQLRMNQCKWPAIESGAGLDAADMISRMQPLSLAAYVDDPLLQLAAAFEHVKQEVRAPLGFRIDRRHACTDVSDRRVRVGYVSSDLCDHAIGSLTCEVFELHDRSRFEVFVYACGPRKPSAFADRIRAAVEHWIDINDLDDDPAAARIAADGVDVLVDLNGHTKGARTAVFARRPAPIQVNWLGFPGSMGSPFHHYIIADEWIIPPQSEAYYSERVLRLPCYQSNESQRIPGPSISREEAGLPRDAFVFCCFNGAQKITPEVFSSWLAILGQVETSVLWLLESTPDSAARLAACAQAAAIAPERIVFAPRLPNREHLARYPLADLFLDTFPYGAHTTASDALWAGVPVLTISGRSFASRVCGSLVRAAGLSELVCAGSAEYVARAIELASHPDLLDAVKDRLVQGRDTCTLFDMPRLTRRLEQLYVDVCAEHQAGRTPRPDLRNLDAYLEIGSRLTGEITEPLCEADYRQLYRTEIARRHLARPIAPDRRLWTEADIAAVEDADFDRTSGAVAAATTPPQVHPLLRLRDLYDEASLILCQPADAGGEARLHALVETAAALRVDTPEGAAWAGWETHYRLAFDAITPKPELEQQPAAAQDLAPEARVLISTGGELDWGDLPARACSLGAEVVFFVAADETYVDQYASHYIHSVMAACDVPYLVLVHVIGGRDRLDAIAAKIGVRDPRLVYSGDAFDAQAVITLCIDAPPKGLAARPLAHYQSARFIWLDVLLDAMELPVFVSDIDLILQRGVADLIARSSEADIVLNENAGNTNAGSRLTANLMLIAPSAHGRLFARYLSIYLRRHLEAPAVSRWIDQFGLVMTRHWIALHAPGARIAYFDPETDINNVIYPAYAPNPFRFFSLYHGFDVDSLGPAASSTIQQAAA